MKRTPTSDIRARLEQWRDYMLSGNGYPGRSSIAAANEPGRLEFNSRPPRGVEIPSGVALIIRGIRSGNLTDRVLEMAAITAWYLRQRQETEQDVARCLRISVGTLKNRRSAGEAFLEGWIAANDSSACNQLTDLV